MSSEFGVTAQYFLSYSVEVIKSCESVELLKAESSRLRQPPTNVGALTLQRADAKGTESEGSGGQAKLKAADSKFESTPEIWHQESSIENRASSIQHPASRLFPFLFNRFLENLDSFL